MLFECPFCRGPEDRLVIHHDNQPRIADQRVHCLECNAIGLMVEFCQQQLLNAKADRLLKKHEEMKARWRDGS